MYEFLENPELNDISPLRDFGLETPDFFNSSICFSDENTRQDDEQPLVTLPKPSNELQSKSFMSRGKRSDDFDYQKYIKEEMDKLDTSNMSEPAKKKLIQKIRNRLSAQRSRTRAKGTLELLKEENCFLKSQNADLTRKINELQEDNAKLNAKVQALQESKKSHSTTDYDDEKSLDSIELQRTSRPKLPQSRNAMFLCLIGAVLILNQRDISDSVKVSGVVPLLTKEVPKSNYQLQTLDNYCESFCSKVNDCNAPRPATRNSLAEWDSIKVNIGDDRQLRVFDGPMEQEVVPFKCFESDSPTGLRSHNLLIDKRAVVRMDDDKAYYFAPELRAIRLS